MKKINRSRAIVQLFFLLVIAAILGIRGTAGLHFGCPFAVHCVLLSSAVNGMPLWTLGVYMGLAILAITAIWGRFFCGWICPFGTIQDWLGRLRGQYSISLPQWFFYFKYVFFVLILSLTLWNGKIVFAGMCPVQGLSGALPLFSWGLGTILLIFLASIWIPRLWCLVFCPFAALMNIVQYIMLIITRKRFPRTPQAKVPSCCNCKICEKVCFQQKNVHAMECRDFVECIRGLDCLAACPICKKEKQAAHKK